jgi:hypothetical protein
MSFGLFDALDANIAAEHNHGFKKRRRVFAAAYGDTNWLKHWPGLEA